MCKSLKRRLMNFDQMPTVLSGLIQKRAQPKQKRYFSMLFAYI